MTAELISESLNASGAEILSSFPETRGFHLQISAKTTEMEIISNISSYREIGFNTILIDIFKHGWTIFPSETMRSYRFPAINPSLSQNNLLTTVFNEIFLTPIKCYAVVDLLCVGDKTINKRGPILSKKPDWGVRNKIGDFYSESDQNRAYLCPANPDARRFLGNLCSEILEAYPFHGIIFDMSEYSMWDKIDDEHPCCCGRCIDERNYEKTLEKSKEDDSLLERFSSVKNDINSNLKMNLTELMEYLYMRTQKTRRPFHFLLKIPGKITLRQNAHSLAGLWRAWQKAALFNEFIIDKYDNNLSAFEKDFLTDLSLLYENALSLPTIATEDAPLISQMILSCRKFPSPGFIYRNPEIFEEPDLKRLKDTLKAPAEQVELNSLLSISQLVLKLISLTFSVNPILDFFQDLLKFLEIEGEALTVSKVELLIENFNSIESHIRDFDLDDATVGAIASTLSLIRRILFFHMSLITV